MQPTLIAFRQCPNSWRKMLRLGLLALAALNPPAFLLAQNPARGIKFERIGLEQGLSQSRAICILQEMLEKKLIVDGKFSIFLCTYKSHPIKQVS